MRGGDRLQKKQTQDTLQDTLRKYHSFTKGMYWDTYGLIILNLILEWACKSGEDNAVRI